jgi:hypothetical protein
VNETGAGKTVERDESRERGETGSVRLVVDGQALRLEDVGLTDETARHLAEIVTSISVSATKP